MIPIRKDVLQKIRRKVLFCTLAAIMITLFGMALMVKQRKEEVEYQAIRQGNILKYSVDTMLINLDTLSAMVVNGDGRVEHFYDICESLMKNNVSSGAIKSLQIAPDGVVTQICPEEGNEAGKINLFADPDRKTEAKWARDTGNTTLAGPYELLQGGFAAIARKPVYLSDENGKSVFWGFVIEVLDMNETLKPAHLESFVKDGYDYCFWRIDAKTGEKAIISKSAKSELRNPISVDIEMPNVIWHFDVTPKGGWISIKDIIFMLLFVFVVTIICTEILYHYYVYREKKEAEKKDLLLKNSLNNIANNVAVFRYKYEKLYPVIANKQFLKFMQLSEDDYKSMDVDAFMNKISSSYYDDMKNCVNHSELQNQNIECQMESPADLKNRWFLINWKTITDEDGTILLYVTMTDIDNEKQQREQLKSTQKELANQIENGLELEYFAEHDPLTGLLNRKAYNRIVDELNREKISVGFMLVDIDKFKEINDDYGHAIGDQMLKKGADILNQQISDRDYVFRFGGDEFVILLCNSQVKNAKDVAQQIKRMSQQFLHTTNDLPAVTFSVGLYFSKDGIDENVFKYADEALYHTKNNGRAGYTILDENRKILLEEHQNNSLYLTRTKTKLLEDNQTGTWRIEMPDNNHPRLYGDDTMYYLIGVDKNATPEEVYDSWILNVDSEYRKTIEEAVKQVLQTGDAEVTYPYHHPKFGIMNVRCTATNDNSYSNGACIYGFHHNITNTKLVTRDDDTRLMLDALNESYFCNYYIDLEEHTYIAYKQTEELEKKLGISGNIENLSHVFLSEIVCKENQDAMKRLLKFDDLKERILQKNYLECEYAKSENHVWRRARILPIRYDADGEPTHIMFVISSIDEEKRLELDNYQQTSMLRMINQQIFNKFQTFLGIIDLDTEKIQIIDESSREFQYALKNLYPYDHVIQFTKENVIVEQDGEMFVRLTNIENLKKQLSDKDKYEFTINRYNANGEEGIFIYHFCYSDDKKKKIICLAEEITSREETDFLTEELNMKGFLRKAESILHKNPGEYVMLHLDISGFKAINDQIGYERGNVILRNIAELIRNSKLEPYMITRDMADHFYCLISKEKIDYKEITRLCKQKLSVDNASITVLMQCGIYFIDDINIPVRNMCDKARLAENAVTKSDGKSPYFVFTDEMKQEYLQRKEIISSLDEAIEKKEFITFFQPIYSAKTKEIVSAEALIRWIKPDGKVISPDQFIPTLEENGQISKIDLLANHLVQSRMMERSREGRKIVPVSVNLSRIDFYNEDVMEQLLEFAQNFGLSKQYLRFEITESAYSDIPVQSAKFINKLRSYGAKILIDDFGKGYSSLGSLSAHEFDIVKLDMSFIRQIGKNIKTEAIISSSIDMAHKMDAKVIAEGVETQEQYEFLRDMDCDYIQGYYFSRPLPQNEFEILLDIK